MSASKTKGHSIAGDGSKIICQEDKSRTPRCFAALPLSVWVLQTERLQRWPIDSRRNPKAIIGLERR
jgi:hypothetical protein